MNFDEITNDILDKGTGRFVGPETWARCATHLCDSGARLYELGRMLTSGAPQSPFATPTGITSEATRGAPGTVHAHNGERLNGGLTQQGTHLDALGHFGVLPDAWDGHEPFPAAQVTYFGGLSQHEVKPNPDAPLARLGVDSVPPVLTTAVLLDASAYLADGEMLEPGREIGRADITSMLDAQGLGHRGILPGDALLIHTGWGARWGDPDDGTYYRSGPGLSRLGAEFIADFQPALVALDNPFTDPVCEGQIDGQHEPPPGMLPNAPFGTHHQNLVQAGILQIQNMYLSGLARDRVFLSCFMVLPLLIKGASGSPVRPIAIGSPSASARAT